MEGEQTEDVIRHMAALWASWVPTQAQKDFWQGILAKHSLGTAMAAVELAYGEKSRMREPEPKIIREKLAALTSAAGGDTTETGGLGETCFWVQCIEAPEKHPGRLGWFVPLIYATPAAMPIEPEQRAAADRLAQRCTATYGGKWRVIDDATFTEMQQGRQEWLATRAAQQASQSSTIQAPEPAAKAPPAEQEVFDKATEIIPF